MDVHETTDAQASGESRHPTIRQLVAFLRVAQTGSYSRAAQSLTQAPSHVWRAVARLEKTLGVQLFESAAGEARVRTSPVGEALRGPAQQILNGVRQMEEITTDVGRRTTRILRVGCYPAHVTRSVAHGMRTFAQTHPTVKVQLPHLGDDQRQGGGERLFSALARGEVDLIVAPDRSIDAEALIAEKLYDWHLKVLLPPHMKEWPPESRVTDLQGHRLLLSPRGFSSRTIFEGECLAAKFEPHIAFETPSTEALLALCEHGHGLAIIPDDAESGRHQGVTSRLVGHDGNPLGGTYGVYYGTADAAQDASLIDLARCLTAAAAATTDAEATSSKKAP